MGYYRFAIPDCDHFRRESLMSAQIVGLDGIPWPCKTTIDQGLLVIFRNTDISGRLLVPFRSTDLGDLGLTTGTLPQREDPYFLEVELARGSLSRLRNQVSLWQEGGLQIDADFERHLADVTEQFSQALFSTDADQPKMRTEICLSVIQNALDLMFQITDEFSSQVSEIRRNQQQKHALIVGTIAQPIEDAPLDVDHSLKLAPIQTMINPRLLNGQETTPQFDLSQTDAVVQRFESVNELRILGPVLDFGMGEIPTWLSGQSTFDARLTVATALCRQLGKRLSGKIKAVHVVSGLNGIGHAHFTYPQQLQLALEMLEALDQTMTNVSLLVSFDQPWGERLSMATGGIQAMEIADSLLRYGARLSALGLEFNLSYWPHGTMLRDPLQWVDLIDRWSQFGLPLAMYFSAPTGTPREDEKTSRFFQTIVGDTSDQRLPRYLDTIFRMIANRPSVNILGWHYLTDQTNQRFPLAGLMDNRHEPKPIAAWLRDLVSELKQFDSSADPSAST